MFKVGDVVEALSTLPNCIQKGREYTVTSIDPHSNGSLIYINGVDSRMHDSWFKKMEAPTSALTTQEGGSHYKSMKIQPIEYALANNLGMAEASVVKYVSRYKNKNGVEDLKKARHFLDILIEHIEKENNK